MFNFFQNIIAWEFWEKRQLPYLVPERKGCKTQTHSPMAALHLVWPRLCLWILSCQTLVCSEPLRPARIFPAVPDVFVQHSHKCHSCGTMTLIVFVSRGFHLKFCCPVSCILRCVTGTVSTVDIPEWNPENRSTPGDGKYLSSAGHFKPVNSVKNIPHSNFTTGTTPSRRAGGVSSLQNCKLNVSTRI